MGANTQETGVSEAPRAVRSCCGWRELGRDPGLWALLLAAALVRALLGGEMWASDPLAQAPLSDAAYYLDWARALAAGEAFHELDARPYWLPPLYPWCLSLVVRAGGGVGTIIVLQLVLGWLATLGVIGLAWRFAGRGPGLAAGWLWTLYLPVVFFETRLLAVNAAVPLAIAALCALQELERRGFGGRAGRALPFLVGLLLGAAALARPNLLLAAPAALAALWIARRASCPAAAIARGAALLGLGLLGGLAPALYHNAQSGEPVAVTANGGVNFWLGNNPDARGTFHAPGPEWGSIENQRPVSLAQASAAEGRELGERAAGAWWFARGRSWLFDEPAAALGLWSKKLADHHSSYEYGIQYVPGLQRRFVKSAWLTCVPFGLLLLLAALGWRGAGAGRLQLVAWLGMGLAGCLLYFTYSRFRLPLLPALLPFAGRGACALLTWARGGARPGGVALVVALALGAQSFVDFERPLAELPYRRHLEANSLADMALAAEDPDQSRELLEAALATVASSPRAQDGLAGKHPEILRLHATLLLGAGDPGERDPARAVALLRAWISRSAPAAPGYDELCVLLAVALFENPALAADPRESRALLEELLARDPDHPTASALLYEFEGL